MLGDQPYHLIAFEAYIDNPSVMHHLSVFACDDSGECRVPLETKTKQTNKQTKKWGLVDRYDRGTNS